MIKKEITYTDYNGIERKETFWFHLSKAELLDMMMASDGDYAETVQRIIDAKDVPALISMFKDLMMKSYGVKSEDGRRFVKSKELTEEFEQSAAYSDLYMELVTDTDKAIEFVTGIIPADLESKLTTMSPPLTAPIS